VDLMLPPGALTDGPPDGNTLGRFHKVTVSYALLIPSIPTHTSLL
jgi:hypothetical protein